MKNGTRVLLLALVALGILYLATRKEPEPAVPAYSFKVTIEGEE